MRYYAEIRSMGGLLIKDAVWSLFGELLPTGPETAESLLVLNTLPWERTEVVSRTGAKTLALVKVPSMGCSAVEDSLTPPHPVTVTKQADGSVTMENGVIAAHLDSMGRVMSLRLVHSGRESVQDGHCANQFVIFDDVPLYWDAWDVMDYHLETRKPITTLVKPLEIVLAGGLRGSVKFSLQISERSVITQEIILDAMCPYLRFLTQVWKGLCRPRPPYIDCCGGGENPRRMSVL
ncbi:alpha-mannosidase 2C1-like [Chrysemys picta bellii]|uniref:alpha-mannosidase 2C1-like n=1 Tax=Chrysemys picta bellii TaxID=8478 RepID=UPI0032B29B53